MSLKLRISLLFCCTLLIASACSKDKDPQSEKDDAIIREYIVAHDLEAVKTTSGLYYVIDVPGNDQHPTINNNVKVAYVGYLTSGTVFDEGTITFPLSGVIEGWREGIPLFGKGGKGKLLIPSGLGYGSRSQGSIPANSVLIFDIHLIDIK